MITFNELPQAVGQLQESQSRTERMVVELLSKFSGNGTDQEKLLTVTETAEFLNLSVPTIYSLVHQGVLPNNKKGKRLYFLQSEITQWVRSGRRKTLSEVNSEAKQYITNRRERSQS